MILLALASVSMAPGYAVPGAPSPPAAPTYEAPLPTIPPDFVVPPKKPYLDYLPNFRLTPGATNPAVTQANIGQTICVKGWTKTIRPPVSYTNALKLRQMSAMELSGAPSLFEEDHFIALEIGGNPTDPANLWPQKWAAPFGAHQKDYYENFLHRQVCAGRMTLAQAQAAISANWVIGYLAALPKVAK